MAVSVDQASGHTGALASNHWPLIRPTTPISDAEPYEKQVELLQTSTQASAEGYLIVSPYLELDHQLRLSTLELQNQLFARALTTLKPVTSEYATTKYEEAFDWSGVMAVLRKSSDNAGISWKRMVFYVVEFRSQLKESIDRDLLFKLDKLSHAEATASGGLLKYWFGIPDGQRRNLATCLWRSKEDAVDGGRGPWHAQARRSISQMYSSIHVKGLQLEIGDGVQSWSFNFIH